MDKRTEEYLPPTDGTTKLPGAGYTVPASCYAGRGPYASSSGEFNRAPVSGTELPYARGRTPSLQMEASQDSPTDRGSAEGPHHSTSPLDRREATMLDKEDLDYSAEDWIAGQLIPSTAEKSRDGAQRNEPRLSLIHI